MDFNEKNGENQFKPDQIEHATRKTLLDEEQPVIDDVEMANNPNAPKSILNPEIQEQYDQAKEPSEEMIRLREYKQRQMQEFTNNYSISQVIPSGWTTFFNVVNTIFLVFALIIAFLVAFGLMFGLRVGIVPTDSMEPNIPVGSMVILKPVNNVNDIHVGDVLSYQRQEGKSQYDFIHRVTQIGAPQGTNGADTIVRLEGDNHEGTSWQIDEITFNFVTGKMVLSVPVLGYVIWFVKNNIILTITAFLTLVITMLLIRSVVERRHAKMEIDRFLTLKAEFEQEAERKFMEQKKAQEDREFAKIMRTNYGGSGSVEQQTNGQAPQNPNAQNYAQNAPYINDNNQNPNDNSNQ